MYRKKTSSQNLTRVAPSEGTSTRYRNVSPGTYRKYNKAITSTVCLPMRYRLWWNASPSKRKEVERLRLPCTPDQRRAAGDLWDFFMSAPDGGELGSATLSKLVHRFLKAILQACTPVTNKMGTLMELATMFRFMKPDGSFINAREMTSILAGGQYVLRSIAAHIVRLKGPLEDFVPFKADTRSECSLEVEPKPTAEPFLDLYDESDEGEGDGEDKEGEDESEHEDEDEDEDEKEGMGKGEGEGKVSGRKRRHRGLTGGIPMEHDGGDDEEPPMDIIPNESGQSGQAYSALQ
jgi:hypothetical protein